MTGRAVAVAPAQPEAAPIAPMGDLSRSLGAAAPGTSGGLGRGGRSGTASARPSAVAGALSGPGAGCG